LAHQELSDPIDENSTESGIIDDDEFDGIGFLEELEKSNQQKDESQSIEANVADYTEATNSAESSVENWQELADEEDQASLDSQAVTRSTLQEKKRVAFIPLTEYQDFPQLHDIIKRKKKCSQIKNW